MRTTDRIFFVTVNLRRSVKFVSQPEYPLLIEALAGARRRQGFLLYGYVWMPDHWHALLWTGYPLTISQVVHDLKKVAGRKLQERRGTHAPLWQHQFWDRFERHAKEFNDRLVYRHFNPARKGLVNKPEDWRWSSGNHFSLDRATVEGCPIRIDYVRLPEEYRG